MATKKSGRNKAKTASKKALKIKDTIDQPTPEQASRVEYLRATVHSEMGQTLGFAYQRRPLFETMAARGGIAPDELMALRHYRTLFDRCERSPTKSCLNIGAGGSGATPFHELAHTAGSIMDARRRLAACDRVLGPYLSTMRGLVLQDRSLSEMAIERFGSRVANWTIVREPIMRNGRQAVVDDVPQFREARREKFVPKSGRHREMIRGEFIAGMRALVARLAEKEANNMRAIREVWIEPGEDGARLCIGQFAPARTYRLWGSVDAMESVLGHIKAVHGKGQKGHVFRDAHQAKLALDEAGDVIMRAGGVVSRLESEELAA